MGNFWTMQIFPSYFFLTFFRKRCNLLKVKSKGRKKNNLFDSYQFFPPSHSVPLRDFSSPDFKHYEMIHQESLKKRLAKLAAPIFIETLLIMMLGAVDTIMLSRHSDSSVAAVGVVNQIIMLTFLIFEVINLGTSVLCSQYLGARLQKKVVQVVGVSILVNIVIGVSVSLFLFSCAGPILRLMGLTPELMTDGMDYMRIVGAFAFFQAISLTLSASLRSANKAIYPMLVTVVVNILNIIGNYSLIFGRFGFPELGVEGAAISTAFSRGVSMVLLFIILFRKHIHRFPVAYFRPFPWPELKNLMKVGLPSAGEQLSYSSSQVVITFFINMLGVEALATRTASTLSCSPTSSALPWHKEAPSASVISSERENLMLPSLWENT